MTPTHVYRATVRWTGDLGTGTSDSRGYSRDHAIEVEGKPPILATSGLSPRSDPARYSPDDLVVGALSSCHMLWYLHLCSVAGIVVTSYVDAAEGTLALDRDGGGHFIGATLRPHVVVRSGDLEVAQRLHEEAHRRCFVANSVNFPVTLAPSIEHVPG